MNRRAVGLALVALTVALPAAPANAPVAVAQEGEAVTALVAPDIASGAIGRRALRGPWVVKQDPEGTGALRGFQAGAFEGRQVTVPHVVNGRGVAGLRGIRSYRGSVAWYRTTVEVPFDSTWALRFESVHHNATVWLDGRPLGRHKGAYLPFELRTRLSAGPHLLVVRADFRGPTRMKRDGWHRTWFNFGGINREITIRPVGASEISAPTVNTQLVDGDAEVDVTAHVRSRHTVARTVRVRGALVRDGVRHELEFAPLRLLPGETKVARANVTVGDPALWAPGSPNLYDLELAVPGEAAWRQRTGLRELRRDGPRILLNGRRLRLHGASLHEDVRGRGDALRPVDFDRLVAHLVALKANSTRSQHALSPALLERLDAAGILVWHGIGPVDAPGSWTSKTKRQQALARERVRQSYFQTQAHPSILAWNLANEVAGNGHPDGQAPYVDDMARELRRRDPGRLVAVDVWGAHPPRGALGPLYRNLDAIAVTNYVGWYEAPKAPKAVVARTIRSRTREFLRTFAGKIVVISEFGAEANRQNPTRTPGGYAFQSRLVGQHIAAYRAFPGLSGMLIWNLRDFAVAPTFAGGSIRKLVPGIHIVRGVNQKGLFDFDGRPKPAVTTVRRAYEALGDGLSG